MRRSLWTLGLAVLWFPSAAHAQNPSTYIDPSLGPYPTFGPGGFIGNGFGYGIAGPRGLGYVPGLYFPGNGTNNGPSPFYSPVFNGLPGAPPFDAPDLGRAGWALRPSLPFTGRTYIHIFRRH